MNVFDIEDKLNDFDIPKGNVLLNYHERAKPAEIFQAVCDLIGSFYVHYGFKYSRSRPKITLKTGDFEIQVAFWSSRSNTAGNYVNLEIIGHAYSVKLAKLDKLAGNTFKGFLLSHTNFWTKINRQNKAGVVNVYLLDGTLAAERTEDGNYAVDIFNCNYNIYGTTASKCKSIIRYVHKYFIEQALGLTIKESMMSYLESLLPGESLGRSNDRFYKYIEIEFGNDAEIINKLIEKKIENRVSQ